MKDKIIAYVLIIVMMVTMITAVSAEEPYVPYPKIGTNEFHDRNQLQKMHDYCFEHADRAANGEVVINDLVKAGLVDSQYYDMSCGNVEQLLQTCTSAFTARFGREPFYGYEFSICPKTGLTNVTK